MSRNSDDLFFVYDSAKSALELDHDHLGYIETVLGLSKYLLTHPEIERDSVVTILIQGGVL